MTLKNNNKIYYVSHLGKKTLSVIDGDSFNIIKEIDTGLIPENVIIDSKNNLYIVSDRDNKVEMFTDLSSPSRVWNMQNNGTAQIDSNKNIMYVSNVEEIFVYDLESGEKKGYIGGFTAINSLKLDVKNKRLFVLDILENKLKVYDTEDLKLISEYREVGINPYCICVNKDDIYIGNKSADLKKDSGNITILHLKSGNRSYIKLKKGSAVKDLKIYNKLLYVINSKLNRIEVLNILTGEVVTTIKTTFENPQRLCISYDEKVALVTSKNFEGKGAVDKIDMEINKIKATIYFEEEDDIPYDIAISDRAQKLQSSNTQILNSEKKYSTAVMAKKVISTYKEKLIFTDVLIDLPLGKEDYITIDKILFKKCKVLKEGQSKERLKDKNDYMIFEYKFNIPYYIDILDDKNNKYTLNGNLSGKQRTTLYVPDYIYEYDVQLAVNSFTKLINNAQIVDKKIKFSASTLILSRVLIEDMIYIPNCEQCNLEKRG